MIPTVIATRDPFQKYSASESIHINVNPEIYFKSIMDTMRVDNPAGGGSLYTRWRRKSMAPPGGLLPGVLPSGSTGM